MNIEHTGMTRRNLLLGAGAVALLGLTARGAGAQAAGRPRLMATTADWADLKARIPGSPKLTTYYSRLRSGRTAMLNAPLETRATWSLYTAREVLDRIIALGALYNLDGDRAAVDRVAREVLHVTTNSATSSWQPPGNANSGGSTWLAHGEIALAAAIGYYWCHDRLTDAQRTSVENGVKLRGINPWMNHPPHDNNWGAVIGGGMGLLLALQGETAFEGLLADARTKLDYNLRRGVVWDENDASTPSGIHTSVYPPRLDTSFGGGGEKEGTGYMSYFMERLTAYFAGYETMHGVEHPYFSRMPGLRGAVDFYAACVGPNGYEMRFSDGTDELARMRSNTWQGYYGRKYDDDYYRHVHARATSYSDAGALSGSECAMWMLNYDGEGANRSPSSPNNRVFNRAEVFSSRSSYGDPNALYVASRVGGDVDEGHTHLDRGSVAVQALGLNFVVDLGEDNRTPTYDDYETGRRWDHYRCRAEGHNTFVVNPSAAPDQATGTLADNKLPKILRSGNGTGPDGWVVVDLAKLYPTLTKAQRGIKRVGTEYVLVQDEVEDSAAINYWSFLHAKKRGSASSITVAPDGKSADIRPTKDGRRLHVRILSPSTAIFQGKRPMPATQLSASRPGSADGQHLNPQFEKLGINLTGMAKRTVAVAMYPLQAGQPTPKAFPSVVPLADW